MHLRQKSYLKKQFSFIILKKSNIKPLTLILGEGRGGILISISKTIRDIKKIQEDNVIVVSVFHGIISNKQPSL